MKADVWMPFYIGDYLADTIGLSLAQHGAYLLLIFAYWRNGGPLPDQDCNRVIALLSKDEGKQVTSFFKIRRKKWHHKRIDLELKKAKSIKAAKTKAGTKGMASRWRDNRAITELSFCYNPSPSPSPSPSKGSDKASDKAKKLSNGQIALARRLETCLDAQWVNDAGKWITRIRENPTKTDRVCTELEMAMRENRVGKTPAQFAEYTWKEFK